MITKINLSELNQQIHDQFDLFICFSSFEERCLSIAENLQKDKIKKSIIFYNEDNLQYVDENKQKLEAMLGETCNSIGLMHTDPIITADRIKDSLCKLSDNINTILLDITTFTHEALLITIRLLQLICPKAKVICGYSNAFEYNPDNERDDKWLSKGISEIRSVLGYPGNIMPARKTHLIIIVGYEYERAANIINALEPSSISIGYGRSDNATTQKDSDANEHYKQLVEQMATDYTVLDCFEVKCNDPFATCNGVLEQINRHKDKNTLIFPLNNKLSTIGVAFSAIKSEDVQLCYAPALTYNYFDYSKAGDSCYLVDITEMLLID